MTHMCVACAVVLGVSSLLQQNRTITVEWPSGILGGAPHCSIFNTHIIRFPFVFPSLSPFCITMGAHSIKQIWWWDDTSGFSWYCPRLLSCQDPHLIAKIPSDPRSIPYHSSNSISTILQDSDTTLTKPPNSDQPLRPLMHYHRSLRTPNNLWEPWSHSYLHLSSSFHFSPLELWSCLHVLVSVFTFPFLIY